MSGTGFLPDYWEIWLFQSRNWHTVDQLYHSYSRRDVMKIGVEQAQAAVPVTVMTLEGELDASNYENVIAKTRELYQEGMRDLLLDLGRMNFMASSGLVALHNIALLMRGQEPQDSEEGWGALHAATDFIEASTGHEPHCKILNPQPKVDRTLEMTGFKNVFAIFTDKDQALASFS
jgi:anti-anti-sigma factor